MVKASISFVMLLVTVISCVSTDYAQAKNVAANFSQPRQTVSQCENCDSGQVSELVFRNGFKPTQFGCNPNEDCRPNQNCLPPAFSPPQITPGLPALPVASPSIVSDVTQNGIVGLFGLVAAAIAGAIGGLKGHFKGTEEDEQYAAYWASVRQNASSQPAKS